MSYLLKNDPLVALFETPITLDFMPTISLLQPLRAVKCFQHLSFMNTDSIRTSFSLPNRRREEDQGEMPLATLCLYCLDFVWSPTRGLLFP